MSAYTHYFSIFTNRMELNLIFIYHKSWEREKEMEAKKNTETSTWDIFFLFMNFFLLHHHPPTRKRKKKKPRIFKIMTLMISHWTEMSELKIKKISFKFFFFLHRHTRYAFLKLNADLKRVELELIINVIEKKLKLSFNGSEIN